MQNERNINGKAILVDLLGTLIVTVALVAVAANYDLFDWFYDFSRDHEDWQLDEFALAFVGISAGAAFFASRRLIEMKREFTRRREAEQQLEILALKDPLTGLFNRRQFISKLNAAFARRCDASARLAVVAIDLDRFKPVNDLHGHATGDRLLQMVAKRIRSVARDNDCVARMGGDEFSILVDAFAQTDELASLATRILKTLEQPFVIGTVQCRIGASLGIAFCQPGDAMTIEELMACADLALYRAKHEGRNNYRFFEPEMDRKAQERSRLEVDLRTALAEGEIDVAYQPLVSLVDGHVEGYELLARWTHPVDGPIPPDRFIPIAEDTGLIGELMLHILDKVCRDTANTADTGYFAINLSPIQLRDPHLCARVLDVLARYQVSATRFEFEVTETALIADLEASRQVLLDLRNAGFNIALDDFGTGYSSLYYLRELPIGKLKIDSSFIMSMGASDESRRIVDAVIALSRSLGLKTTAEGIESEEIARVLTELGCTTGQGYFYGRPIAGNEAMSQTTDAQIRMLRDIAAEHGQTTAAAARSAG